MTRSPKVAEKSPTDLDAALATMSAEALREVVHQVLLELDDRARARVVSSLIARAARTGSGWAPAAVSDEQVAEVLAFVKAAERVGQADPSEFDEYLGRGSAAFLRKDYASAHRIFGALLPPIGDGNIDLGQRELVEDVLGADVAECAAQYVVSGYMLAPVAERAEAVRAAIDEVHGVGHFWEPLRELERVAVEPLPDLAAFLPRWRALIENKPAGKRTNDWDTEEDRWLREVVQRLEGAKGLAKVARATKRADDLRAWCKSLVEAKDWQAALKAFCEAAGLVTDKDYARGEFLDGAALAAQSLGRKDLAAHSREPGARARACRACAAGSAPRVPRPRSASGSVKRWKLAPSRRRDSGRSSKCSRTTLPPRRSYSPARRGWVGRTVNTRDTCSSRCLRGFSEEPSSARGATPIRCSTAARTSMSSRR